MKNMRQVIKTNQNFVTGEHYEQRVLKPVQAARNRVTVQLCDAASGKLIEEAVTENAISSVLESYAYGCIGDILYNKALNGAITAPAFSSIVLSDSDVAELSDPFFIHGNVVGMCNRTDTAGAGSSKYRGTYNSAESYASIEDSSLMHVHLVYDWATSSGNGKIQQISWLPADIRYDYGQERSIGCFSGISGQSVNAKAYMFDRRGNMYLKEDSKYYKVLNTIHFINGIQKLRTEAQESFVTPYEVNGYYYKLYSQFTNPAKPTATFGLVVEKYDTSGTLVDTWTEDLITAVPQLVELRNNSQLGGASTTSAIPRSYCDFDGWIGLRFQYYANSSSNAAFPSRNSSGELEMNKSYKATCYTFYNVLTKQWLHMPSPWDVWCTYENYSDETVLKKLDNRHLCRSGMYLCIKPDDIYGEQYAMDFANPGYAFNNKSQYLYDVHASLPLAIDGYNSKFSGLRAITAQTRLAAPITKTSLNTMKIQYDFFFKIPLPYMTPDHVWDLYK